MSKTTRKQPFMLVLTRDEARRAGLTRYYLGKPCTHGHRSERMVSDSHCVDCKRVKTRDRPPPSATQSVRRERYSVRYRSYYAANRRRIVDRVVNRARERRETDPVFRLRHNIRSRVSVALRAHTKSGSAIALLGCSVEAAKAHIERQFLPGMSWANWGAWHIDHVRPLSAFDLSSPDELARACHFSNLQPLWAPDNLRKGAAA